jgi:Glycosyltransferase family 18
MRSRVRAPIFAVKSKERSPSNRNVFFITFIGLLISLSSVWVIIYYRSTSTNDDALSIIHSPENPSGKVSHSNARLKTEDDMDRLSIRGNGGTRGRHHRKRERDQVVVEESKDSILGNVIPSQSSLPLSSIKKNTPSYKALIFTMDSISDYVSNAKNGGPAGEILIRESLEEGLRALDFPFDVATSDAELDKFVNERLDSYTHFFFDPWTYVDATWQARSFLHGKEKTTYLLSFFGLSQISYGLSIPLSNVLIPYPFNNENSFLGYFMDPRWTSDPKNVTNTVALLPMKKPQGVIWGKKAEYFVGKELVLRSISDKYELHTTLREGQVENLQHLSNIVYHGPLDRNSWHSLLAESSFLLGLGDPLIGPSAVDAIAAGTLFINPKFSAPKLNYFTSQHSYLEDSRFSSNVCTVDLNDVASVLKCIENAIGKKMNPIIPPELTHSAYLDRLRRILNV